MQVCLSAHNNLLTFEPKAVNPHCFDADPEPAPDPGRGGGGYKSAKNFHPPRQNPRYAPAAHPHPPPTAWLSCVY